MVFIKYFLFLSFVSLSTVSKSQTIDKKQNSVNEVDNNSYDQTEPYAKIVAQVCRFGKHSLSPNAKYIYREGFPKDSLKMLGRENFQRVGEVIKTNDLSFVYSTHASAYYAHWSLDNKSIYTRTGSTLIQIDFSDDNFDNSWLTPASPSFVKLNDIDGLFRYEIARVPSLLSNLGMMPLTEVNVGYDTQWILRDGTHNKPYSPLTDSKFTKIESNKETVYVTSNQKNDHRLYKYVGQSTPEGQPAFLSTLDPETHHFKLERINTSKMRTTYTVIKTIDNYVRPYDQYELFNTFKHPIIPNSKDKLWVLSNENRNTNALFEINPRDNSEHMIYSDPVFDISKPIYSRRGNLIGVEIYRESNDFVPLSPQGKIIQSHIAELKPQHVITDTEIHSISDDISKAIFGFSGNSYHKLYLLDLIKNVIKELPMPCIEREHQTVSLWTEVSDGVNILSYYTANSSAAADSPLIVSIHGGPQNRDRLSLYNSDEYFLSRGFSLLRVNYRNSIGFGKHLIKPKEENYQDRVTSDIVESVSHLIQQKKIKPTKIIAYGTSYGGYQVMSLVTNPKYSVLFDGFVSLNGLPDVCNLHTWMPKNGYANCENNSRSVRANRPISHNKPIIIAYGTKDIKVDPNQSKNFIEAHHDSNIIQLEFDGEGHSLDSMDSKIKLWALTEKLML